MIDTDLTEQEAMLAGTARDYFADFVDNAYLNEQEASAEGFGTTRWKQISDLGWTGINLPDHLGGAGGTLAEAGVVARECGRAAFASPLLQTMRALRLPVPPSRLAAIFTGCQPPKSNVDHQR
jgi:alkylation response protein AidB-like acyl-CoA dehydrogenase